MGSFLDGFRFVPDGTTTLSDAGYMVSIITFPFDADGNLTTAG